MNKPKPTAGQAAFIPTKGQAEVLDVLAHLYLAAEFDKNVQGMAGYFEHYQQNGLTARQRSIWEALKDQIAQVRAQCADDLQREAALRREA